MGDYTSGNIHPRIDVDEHEEAALAKRAYMLCMNVSGTGFLSPSIYEYTACAPMSVVLVEPDTGNPYVASGGNGSIAADVTAYIAEWDASIAVGVTFGVVSGTVTANVGNWDPGVTFGSIAGTVTANVGNWDPGVTFGAVAGTVTANVGNWASMPLGVTFGVISGTATVNIGTAYSVTAYIATASLGVTFGVIAGTVTTTVANSQALGVTFGSVAGTVTANVGNWASMPLGVTFGVIAGTVTTTVANSQALGVTFGVVAGTVTANLGRESYSYLVTQPGYTNQMIAVTERWKTGVGLRTRTVYVPYEDPVQLPSIGSGVWGWACAAPPTNTEAVFVGPGAAVTSTPEMADSGAGLWPGMGLELPSSATNIYAVASTATQVLTMATVLYGA